MAKVKLYMIVTNDKYELPLTPPMEADLMAQRLGIRKDSLQFRFTPTYKARQQRSKRKIAKYSYTVVQVEIEE